MELLRRAANPWGQEVILGIGWDLLWAALAAGVVFVVVHTVLVVRLRKAGGDAPASGGEAVGGAGVPARIVRHDLASRIFHWSMALTMFALLITAFAPVMGWGFDWVTIHWIAGLALIATVVYHLIHSIFFQSLRSIWVDRRDLSEGTRELVNLLRARPTPPDRAGKYPVANKLYHHAAAVATVAAIVTGVVMMVRIDTPVLAQNPYLLGDGAWGWIYLLHGLAGVGLVILTITHVYFAVRPEKRWQSRSMIKGWITREEFLNHHDPARWEVGAEGAADPAEPTPARSAAAEGA